MRISDIKSAVLALRDEIITVNGQWEQLELRARSIGMELGYRTEAKELGPQSAHETGCDRALIFTGKELVGVVRYKRNGAARVEMVQTSVASLVGPVINPEDPEMRAMVALVGALAEVVMNLIGREAACRE